MFTRFTRKYLVNNIILYIGVTQRNVTEIETKQINKNVNHCSWSGQKKMYMKNIAFAYCFIVCYFGIYIPLYYLLAFIFIFKFFIIV